MQAPRILALLTGWVILAFSPKQRSTLKALPRGDAIDLLGPETPEIVKICWSLVFGASRPFLFLAVVIYTEMMRWVRQNT